MEWGQPITTTSNISLHHTTKSRNRATSRMFSPNTIRPCPCQVGTKYYFITHITTALEEPDKQEKHIVHLVVHQATTSSLAAHAVETESTQFDSV